MTSKGVVTLYKNLVLHPFKGIKWIWSLQREFSPIEGYERLRDQIPLWMED